MKTKGYCKLKMIYGQNKLEFIDYINRNYGRKNYAYIIKVIDNDKRSSVLYIKETRLDIVKFLCKHAGIRLIKEFDI